MKLSTEQYRHLFTEDNKLIAPDLFTKLIAEAESTQQPLEQLLIEQASISLTQYLEMLSKLFGVPSTTLNFSEIDSEVLATIPKEVATENLAIAFSTKDGKYCIALLDPSNQELLVHLEQTVGTNVELYVTTEANIRRALSLYDGDPRAHIQTAVETLTAQLSQTEEAEVLDQSVQQFVNIMLETAFFMGTSDIHIEPFKSKLVIRFRIDGRLSTISSIPMSSFNHILARIKVLSGLEVDKLHVTQDGRFTADIQGQLLNIRVSCLPSMWGQKVVMRLLPKDAQISNIVDIGMLPGDVEVLKRYIRKPHGMILVTGPTNSGKSTTLFAGLREISLEKMDTVNISTLEDPVEYTLPGVTQVQTDSDVTFADGLRELLRQDIDVLMLGEIRDQETADLAIRTALVGRLVFSTLHTNDAVSTIPRLTDLGVEPYLIASTLSLVIAQRLASKLCTKCREAYQPDQELLEALEQHYHFSTVINNLITKKELGSLDPNHITLYKAVGCAQCNQTGYNGRVGLFEMLEITTPMVDAISQRLEVGKLRQIALQSGMKTMNEDAIAKLLMGQIDLEQMNLTTYA